MAGQNFVELRGLINVRKAWPTRPDKKALCYASVRPDGDGPSFDVTAFGPTAEALGNAHELYATVTGRLAYEKPKEETGADGKKVKWPLVVIAEKVVEHAPDGASDPETSQGPKAKSTSEIPF